MTYTGTRGRVRGSTYGTVIPPISGDVRSQTGSLSLAFKQRHFQFHFTRISTTDIQASKQSAFSQLGLCTSYLIMGLYFIGLYTQRRRDHTLIIFGIMSLMFAVYVSTKGERIIYDLFGSVPVWLFLRIQDTCR